VGFAALGGEVGAVSGAGGFEVGLEAGFEGAWKWDDAVFAALAVVDGDGAAVEIEVFDAEGRRPSLRRRPAP
jgi:hypothetical protein